MYADQAQLGFVASLARCSSARHTGRIALSIGNAAHESPAGPRAGPPRAARRAPAVPTPRRRSIEEQPHIAASHLRSRPKNNNEFTACHLPVNCQDGAQRHQVPYHRQPLRGGRSRGQSFQHSAVAFFVLPPGPLESRSRSQATPRGARAGRLALHGASAPVRAGRHASIRLQSFAAQQGADLPR